MARELYNRANSRYHHFSFLVRKNRIVSYGWNDKDRTHPLAVLYGHRFYSVHSEVAALIRCPFSLNKSRNLDFWLINIRLGGDNKLKYSRPCPHCLRLLTDLNISTILYSTEKGFMKNVNYEDPVVQGPPY